MITLTRDLPPKPPYTTYTKRIEIDLATPSFNYQLSFLSQQIVQQIEQSPIPFHPYQVVLFDPSVLGSRFTISTVFTIHARRFFDILFALSTTSTCDTLFDYLILLFIVFAIQDSRLEIPASAHITYSHDSCPFSDHRFPVWTTE